MKRYSYLLLVALLLLGLIVPVTYSSWVQKKGQPVGQTGTPAREETAPAQGTGTTPTADGEEKGTETGSANSRSEAVGPVSTASGKMPAGDSQQKQAPQQPSQERAAEPAPLPPAA